MILKAFFSFSFSCLFKKNRKFHTHILEFDGQGRWVFEPLNIHKSNSLKIKIQQNGGDN